MRIAWQFGDYQWPVNPNEDSNWTYDPVLGESVPINSSNSKFQYGGMKSPRRQVQGWLWGPQALDQYYTMLGWLRSQTQATLTDHIGQSRKAQLVKFEAKPVNDVGAFRRGEVTMQYTAEFIGL